MLRIGIDLGGTKIEGIALSRSGHELARIRRLTPQGNYTSTLEMVCAVVTALEAQVGRAAPGIGVGIPGALSPATGVVKNANATWLIGRALDRDLEAVLDRPVRLANDANCFAVSEAADGAAAGADVVFGVILGTGVGGGLVVAGRPLIGVNAIAGEWGHNPLPWPGHDEWPGPPCYCGKSGCIEAFLSGPGLTRDHRAVTGQHLPAPAVAAQAQQGDRGAQASLDRYIGRLARALASVVNVVDPDVVVLGGGLSNIDALYRAVPARWREWVFSDVVATRLVRNRHGDSSGVRGAAWLWQN
ncbi:MAG: ROK family protein [Rhodospirillales bacterium]|nr:MAG: ROK family protein [Rhodospirillales bacterium]